MKRYETPELCIDEIVFEKVLNKDTGVNMSDEIDLALELEE